MADGSSRRNKEGNPVVAICYDFDKTLSPDDMQAQGFIQKVGYNVQEFWEESNRLAKGTGMDSNLAWMYLMITKAVGKTPMTKESLREYGSKVRLFPGVRHWFRRIREFGIKNNVIVEHYIISSGLREMIEGVSIEGLEFSRFFHNIFASSYIYGDDESALWPAMAVNYTGKTQFLFRISKGCENIDDDRTVNQLVSQNIRTVPLSNMIYVGDGSTDIPCMKLIRNFGGRAVSVYDPSKTVARRLAHEIVSCGRADIAAPADYRKGGILDSAVSRMVSSIIYNIELRTFARTECIREKQLKKRWQSAERAEA